MNLMKSAMFNLSRRNPYGVVLSRESRRIFHNNSNNNYYNYYCFYSSQSKSEITEKVKESMHNSTKKTGGKFADVSEHTSKEEPIMKNENKEDEDEIKKKFAKDPGVGGKPIDENQGLDVNWRPIDENKS
ncbi:hypothetical protein ABFS83_13G105400 [Erythranthe nasuta]